MIRRIYRTRLLLLVFALCMLGGCTTREAVIGVGAGTAGAAAGYYAGQEEQEEDYEEEEDEDDDD